MEGNGHENVDPVRRDYAPEGEASKTGLGATLRRTLTEFQEDNLSDWAAALTYRGVLTLAPEEGLGVTDTEKRSRFASAITRFRDA